MLSSNTGQGAVIRVPALPSSIRPQSSSETKGMKGWRRPRIVSNTQAAVVRASSFAGPSGPESVGLENSRYQSQKTSQVKW